MIRPVQQELYAVIGKPVSHSLSPVMMNHAFSHLNIAACYLAFQVDDLAEALPVFTAIGLRGLSVTIPHKEAACRLAASIDETAEAIGAVNTLRRRGDQWQGINTDWLGAVRALEQVTPLTGKSALVLGAGGSAKAVIYGLQRQGARVSVTNRTESRGRQLAETFHCPFVPLAEAPLHPFEVIVQCTPVGMVGAAEDELLPAAYFRPSMVVMDLVYRPLHTPFLRFAREAGCTVVSGLEMLLHQGVAQFEWWLERTAPLQAMKDALWKALARENL
jgi:shikimate dehydrogenase